MGGEAQVTVMVLKVDLGCMKCCRKIKKVLCSMPQIRNQLFDDKSNTVTVSVLCCTPEKVADKIRRKAGGTVKGLDIKPSQPPPAEKPKQSGPPLADKPKQGPPPPAVEKPQPQAAPPPHTADKPKPAAPPPAEKPKSAAPPPADKPKQDEKPKAVAAAPPPVDKPKQDEKPKAAAPPPQKPNHAPTQQPQPQTQQVPIITGPPSQGPPMMKPNQPAAFMSAESIPVAGYPSIFPPPMVYYDGGAYYQGQPQHGPVYQYDGYQGRPVGDYYGGNTYRSADYNYTEDNPSTCSVM